MRRKQLNRPKKPEFKIGIVRGYAVHVLKKDFPKWGQKGFVNTGRRPAIVPMPPDKVWAWGIPQTLAETGVERLIGRRIERFNSNLGSYGMGGLGLWGVRLAPFEEAAFGEYLVLPIKGGLRFVRINDARPTFEICESLIGSMIKDVKLTKRKCVIVLKQEAILHLLSLYLDSPAPNDMHYHPQEYEDGQIANYLILQDRRGILTS